MIPADVTIHCMVRDEVTTVAYALLSVLPAVTKALVVDTGSTDGTRELLTKLQQLYPHKIQLDFVDAPNSQPWTLTGRYNPPNRMLTEIRQKMINQTETKFFWILDGDEVYRDISTEQVVKAFKNWPEGKWVIYIPLLWFVDNIWTLGDYSPGAYGVTGRLFRTAGTRMHGTFPGEMHMGPMGEDLGPNSGMAAIANWIEPYHHFEMVSKPWRRRILGRRKYTGPQPEVFARFGRKEKPDERKSLRRDTDDGVGKVRVNGAAAGVRERSESHDRAAVELRD